MAKLKQIMGEHFLGTESLKFMRQQENFESDFYEEGHRQEYRQEARDFFRYGRLIPNLSLIGALGSFLVPNTPIFLPLLIGAGAEFLRGFYQLHISNVKKECIDIRDYLIECEKDRELMEKPSDTINISEGEEWKNN